jgi:hypothetical protein
MGEAVADYQRRTREKPVKAPIDQTMINDWLSARLRHAPQ